MLLAFVATRAFFLSAHGKTPLKATLVISGVDFEGSMSR
jgi:hypothetical protein